MSSARKCLSLRRKSLARKWSLALNIQTLYLFILLKIGTVPRFQKNSAAGRMFQTLKNLDNSRFKKKKEKLALVFYIGSSSVGGALFLMQSSGVPKILISLREKLPLRKTLNIDSFASYTLKALDTVAAKIYKA